MNSFKLAVNCLKVQAEGNKLGNECFGIGFGQLKPVEKGTSLASYTHSLITLTHRHSYGLYL